MAENSDSKSWWQRMSSQPAGLSTRDRQKSLDAKFSDPTFLTDEPGFPSVAQKPGPGQQIYFSILILYHAQVGLCCY